MMHTRVFDSEFGHLSQILVRCPKKIFKSHPRILYFRHAIPLLNCQPELACPVEYCVGDVDRMYMCARCTCDVIKLEELLDCGEHGCDRVAWVVNSLLDDVLPFKDLVSHQLAVVVF